MSEDRPARIARPVEPQGPQDQRDQGILAPEGPEAPAAGDVSGSPVRPDRRWAWAALGFVAFALLMISDTRAWDVRVTGWLHGFPSWPVLKAAESLTVFGSVQLTGALVLWSAWGAGRRFGSATGFWVVAPFLACLPLEFAVKVLLPFFKAAPPVSPRGVVWAWFRVPGALSFPSGHMLRATYLVGVLLAWEAVTREGAAPSSGFRALALGGLALFGASQVYLGNHWPSDVMGGFLLGACLVLGARRRWRW